MEIIERFVKLIDKRDRLVQMHFGGEMSTMLNFPEEREWYANNISPIDKKLIKLAKIILPNEQFKHIANVYNNEFLINKYKGYKLKNQEPQR